MQAPGPMKSKPQAKAEVKPPKPTPEATLWGSGQSIQPSFLPPGPASHVPSAGSQVLATSVSHSLSALRSEGVVGLLSEDSAGKSSGAGVGA